MSTLKWEKVSEFFVAGKSSNDGIQLQVLKAAGKDGTSMACLQRFREGKAVSKKIGLRAKEMVAIAAAYSAGATAQCITMVEGRYLRISRDFTADGEKADLHILMDRQWPEELVVPAAMLSEFCRGIADVACVMKMAYTPSDIRTRVFTYIFTYLMKPLLAEQRVIIKADMKLGNNMTDWRGFKLNQYYKDCVENLIEKEIDRINTLAMVIFSIAGKEMRELFNIEHDGFAVYVEAHMFLLGSDVPDSNGGLVRVAIEHLCALNEVN
jgi:hypothetical protein